MTAREAEDRKWMRRALTLARLSEGGTRPNPPVGAVVVRGGRNIGEGRHVVAGGSHAEVAALDACRGPAAGATLYVTLEPCSTTGRTPPCTERILREGIARVVVGCVDRNARHGGRGLELLREGGVGVECGVCAAEAERLAEPFFTFVRTGRPFVTLKLALTLDGKVADREMRSKWITGAAARAEVQRMRRRADAVMVGAGTVCADDPSLLYRGRSPGGEKLLRVVIDGAGAVPADARVFTDAARERTWVATLAGGEAAADEERVWRFAPDAGGHVPLAEVMARLGGLSVMHVLCEGGGRLAGALHDAGLVDEYCFFYAPVVLGDRRARGAVEGCGSLLADAARMRLAEVRRFGEDVMVRVRKG